MGVSQSYPGLTEDLLEDYTSLTYLSKGEILYLMKKFYSINPEMIKNNFHHRFSKEEIINKFYVLKNNPFQDRIFAVFSSECDDCFSFEDMIDLCSVMSADCPAEVKATWAFRIFDLDEDNQITAKDISRIVDRLTWNIDDNRGIYIDRESKLKIANVFGDGHQSYNRRVHQIPPHPKEILNEINLDNSGSIGLNEFKLIMSRIPEFTSSFYFRL